MVKKDLEAKVNRLIEHNNYLSNENEELKEKLTQSDEGWSYFYDLSNRYFKIIEKLLDK